MTTYKSAGVDIEAGTELVERLKTLCPEIGGFNGLYPLGDNYLVASTDGVGTKLKLAFALEVHDTIGIDLVAMNVNDILTAGAKPLFFLDYFATSRLIVDKGEQILNGILQGCKEAECVLLGGETAEMPGFYHEGEYDLAGFVVGLVAKKDLIDGRTIKTGDALVGIASSGFHSNGFSLIRKVIESSNAHLDQPFEKTGQSLGQALLTPTRIYVKKIFNILKQYKIKGMAHITGGGFNDNIHRMLPPGLAPGINKKSWAVPSIFRWVQKEGAIFEEEMFRTFNMGIGMVLAMDPIDAKALCQSEKDCWTIGQVVQGDGIVWA
jgi:phosphoribosylformylglycinamidine cyclo-ligase